ncbi:MAG: Chorismate mutase, partial [Bacteroidota bacterium]
MKNLSDLRKEIDLIDDAILKLLIERMDVVDQVGNLKRANNSIIYHPDREKEIIDRLANQPTGR